MFGYWAGVQELEGSTARQLAQAGQQKYSMPWMSRSVYKWEVAGGQGSPRSTNSGSSVGSALLGDRPQLVIGWWEKLYCVLLILHMLHYYHYSFLCCLIKLSLSQPTSFNFCPFSSPSHCWVLVASCQVKPRQSARVYDPFYFLPLDMPASRIFYVTC